MNLGLTALLLFFPVSVFVPGFIALRRVRLPEVIRLTSSVGVSVAFLYAATFLLHVLGAGPSAFAILAAAILAVGVYSVRELRDFLSSPQIRTLLAHYAVFAVCLLLLAFVIRSFSGGMWAGDWVEHYERSLFFCGGVPIDIRFTGDWSLTARPPLDNIVVAFFMRIAGTEFKHFQLAKILVASLQFLGAASLAFALVPARGSRWHRTLLALAVLLCLNPAVTQNATYTWTRALTTFLLLQAAALFVLAVRDGGAAPRLLSYLHLGMAFVTHYSSVPYIVALGFVELRLLLTSRLALKDAALSVAAFVAASAPWMVFAVHHFGLGGTFLSPSTVSHHSPSSAVDNVLRVLLNLGLTLVPHPLRPGTPLYEQDYLVGYLRDYAFLAYQVSLPMLMGVFGSLAVAWLLGRDALRQLRAGLREGPILVALFVGLAVLIGIGCVPGTNPHGMAHICLQPLGVGGLAYLAARWIGSPAWLKVGVAVGLAIDAVFGIWAQFWMEHLTPYDLAARGPWNARITDSVIVNFASKQGLARAFLGDLPGRAVLIGILIVTLLALVTWSVVRSAEAATGIETE